MKAGREHRVLPTTRTVEILTELSELSTGPDAYVFRGQKKGRPLSIMAMVVILRRMDIDFTVHDFRLSFRDWAGEETAFPREDAEAALAHVVDTRPSTHIGAVTLWRSAGNGILRA